MMPMHQPPHFPNSQSRTDGGLIPSLHSLCGVCSGSGPINRALSACSVAGRPRQAQGRTPQYPSVPLSAQSSGQLPAEPQHRRTWSFLASASSRLRWQLQSCLPSEPGRNGREGRPGKPQNRPLVPASHRGQGQINLHTTTPFYRTPLCIAIMATPLREKRVAKERQKVRDSKPGQPMLLLLRASM